MELENKVLQLKEEIENKSSRKSESGETLPHPPELHTLSGHRDNITSVKFHPVFNLVVSSSLGMELLLLLLL